MRRLRVQSRDLVLTTVAGLALLGLGFALVAGGSVLAVAAVLTVGTATAGLLKFDLSRILLVATCASAFITGLPEIYLDPVRLRLALAVLVLLLSAVAFLRGGRLWLPWWILALASAIVLATALVLMFPISVSYLNSRVVDVTFGPQPTADLVPAASALLSILGLPLAAVMCSLLFRRAPLWIAVSFVSGNALSALVAYTDFLGLTSLSATLGGCGVPGGRACGFSSHPVLLTIGTVYSAGLATWFVVRPSIRSRIFGAVSLSALVLGTYASGTRGGVLGVVFLVTASVLILPQYRRRIHVVLLGAVTALAVAFVIVPGVGYQLLLTTRFVDSPSAASSNQARIDAMWQGWHDFLESPVYGIGLHVLFQAHNGYIQSLASGGLILLIGILALQLGALWESVRLMRVEPMATALVATMLTRIGFEAIEGALVNYAAVVPFALIAALRAQQRWPDARTETADAGRHLEAAPISTRAGRVEAGADP